MEASIWNIQLGDTIAAATLCKKIELECQPDLLTICRQVEIFFTLHAADELDHQNIELVLMVFAKLVDELTHLFLKEKGIVYPGIIAKGEQFALHPGVIQQIQHTQDKITTLLNRIRQLLNNFQMQPDWSAEWKNCVQHFFQLENKIHQWIYIEQNMLYSQYYHPNPVNE